MADSSGQCYTYASVKTLRRSRVSPTGPTARALLDADPASLVADVGGGGMLSEEEVKSHRMNRLQVAATIDL